MTLKEKFKEILTAFCISNWEDECEKIADEFAIGFAEWIFNDWLADERWSKISDEKELLENYKKEKGL
jgi:hypothetical protein